MRPSPSAAITPPAPPAAGGFSPLDAELGLAPHQRLTPRVAEVLARLGATLGFGEAAEVLALALGVRVSEATLRRHTYAAGTAALAVEAAELARVERDPPRAADPPARLQLSIDATKAPLVGGAWTDVKLAVIAELAPAGPAAEPPLDAVNLTYAARWEPAAAFGRTLTLEASRRGLDEARLVVSPNDGADWIQGALDLLAPRAVRILDEPHAAEHLATIGGLLHGDGTLAARTWTADQRRRLLEEGPAPLLVALAAGLAQGPHPSAPAGPDGEAPAQALAREAAYFRTRAAHLDYAAFRRAGYPIGSGIVESGHKVVIGRRFKGAGQHWAPHRLNPLLVLRTVICNGRWAASWPPLWAEQVRAAGAARQAAQRRRRAARAAPPPPPAPPAPPGPAAPAPAPAPALPAPRPKRVVAGRPTADHPWRRPFPLAAQRRAG